MYRFLDNIKGPEDIKNLNYDELDFLCLELRDFLLKSISKTGGHLASNLGVVELSVSLHKVFNSPKDKIIFDVGHQGYIHKMLTGRKADFSTLRQYGGMSGFLKRNESQHDHFDAGHSSTSISVAAGFVKGRQFSEGNNSVVAVIGDGAMTGGMAYEALNNLGNGKDPVIVVLNDNEMSISENVGGLSEHLSKLRTAKRYSDIKDKTKDVLSRVPRVGDVIVSGARRLKDSVKYLLVPGMFFEDIGFTYIGPIDGHNIKKMDEALERAKRLNEPVLVHIITQKGKGYKKAEENPNMYHGVGPFDLEAGVKVSAGDSYSEVFGRSIVKLAKEDKRIYAITAAMPDGTGLSIFKEQFPERFIDVGIAEQHAVTMSAGMALCGIVPVFAVYSTFLQRAYDQILHDVCIQNLHVVFAIDRAGIVGQDGETHHGVFDIAFLRHIPNMTILAPTNGVELELMLESAINDYNSPVAIRYPRGSSKIGVENEKVIKNYKDKFNNISGVCEPEIVYSSENVNNKRICIIALGSMMVKAIESISALELRGISVTIVNPKVASDQKLSEINSIIKTYNNVITIEDGSIVGGFGELIKLNNSTKNIVNIGFEKEFIPAGQQNELFEVYGLSSTNIIKIAQEMIDNQENKYEN